MAHPRLYHSRELMHVRQRVRRVRQLWTVDHQKTSGQPEVDERLWAIPYCFVTLCLMGRSSSMYLKVEPTHHYTEQVDYLSSCVL